MDLQLRGKKALVCASSKGIGRAIADGLAQEGVDLLLCARDGAALEAAARDIRRHDVAVETRSADLTRREDVKSLIAWADGVDILINNVGGPAPSSALETTEEQWRLGFERLFASSTVLTQGLVTGMQQREFGRVITVTSLVAVEPNTSLAVSTAMRAAVTAFSKTLSVEVAASGVTVHTLMPGLIETDRLRSLQADASKKNGTSLHDEMQRMTQSIPMKRLGTPEEFAALAVFLCSPLAAYLTGLNIAVDGGSRRAIV